MLPSRFVELEIMPVTSSGKIDRKRLPDPEGMDLRNGREYIAPRNAIEEKLVRLWQSILGKEKIGVQDNFFESGGHSLKAIRLINLVQKEFEVRIPLKDVYNEPTIESMATVLYASLWLKNNENIEREDSDIESLAF
jgi:acyl carrier protein